MGEEIEEVKNSNRDGDLNEGQTKVTSPPTQEAAIIEQEIKVEDNVHEASDDEKETEPEDNELRSTTIDNDNHSTDSISITDSMEDDDTGGMDEEGGEQGDVPRLISRSDTPTQQSSLRRGLRMIQEIDYKTLSGVREYNSNR